MPDGEMKWRLDKNNRLPSFENDTLGQEDHANFSEGTIIFEYNFPSGAQKNEKGETIEYYSDYRKAFLPSNIKGTEVFKKLLSAFKLRLTFQVGQSLTTGQDNSVTWAGIHHKTSRKGGAFGYPDEGYLDRVLDELKSRNIEEDTETEIGEKGSITMSGNNIQPPKMKFNAVYD